MADPFGVNGSAHAGDPFGIGSKSGAAAPKKQGGGILSHLVHDVGDTLANVVPGAIHAVEHPIGTAKEIGKSYEETYSPLLHGHVGRFLHGVEQHPLGPLLDLATVLTLGAGGVAKAGALLSKSGAIADTSRLAQLGKTVDLTVPDFAKRAGQAGEDIAIKKSSANPLIRGRQVKVNELLNRLPASTPIFGSSARVLKALAKEPERAAARLGIEAQPFSQAFGKLTTTEKAAWHLAARGVHPVEYAMHLGRQKGPVSAATLNILKDPKVAQLVEKPSAKLADALEKGRALSETMTHLKVAAGHISHTAAAEAPYRLLRQIHGAEFVEPTDAAIGKSPALEAATVERDRIAALHQRALDGEHVWLKAQGSKIDQAAGRTGGPSLSLDNPYRERVVTLAHAFDVAQQKVDRLEKAAAKRKKPTGWVGGKSIEQIAKDLNAAGKRQPFYVPDSAATGKSAGRFASKPSGLAEPAVSGTSKANRGVLANRGLLAMNANPLTREFVKHRNHTEASLLHDELVKHAAELPKGTPKPVGYEYLKLNRGEPAAPYTERIGAEFEHALEPGTVDKVLTQNEDHPDIATAPNGNRLVVPSEVRQILENKSSTYHGTLHALLYSQPTSVWKHLVLGLRPAFFANITVGNSILGALQMAPGRLGFAAWLNQVLPKSSGLFGSRLTKSTMEQVFPEQAAGSFGHAAGFTSNKGLSAAKKAAQGVMPATIAYENVLRRAMAEGWAKATPEIRAEMKRNGGDVNTALRTVAEAHPHVIGEISKRIDDALGNYRTYGKLERAIKQVIPFYGWDRHITRSTARLASERPGTINALTKTGQVGKNHQDATLGALPSYMQGDIRLGGLPGIGALNGRTPILQTRSLDPFTAVGELASIPQALTGQAGVGSEVLSSGLNPIVQALIEQITGRSLLSGAPLAGNAFANAAANIPQASLVAALTGHGKKTKPTSLYQADGRSKLAALFGVPVKKVALGTAHLYASQEKR